MTTPLRPLAAFSSLSIGISRTTIRLGTSTRRWKPYQPELTGFKKGWGEKIWVWRHFHTNQIVYSHDEIMNSLKALAQLPFNGKKTKPTKLRKDYWGKMCVIEFGEGNGMIGRSVYQKLREFRRLHELSWGDEVLRKPDNGEVRTMKERGETLNDQRANAVADIAAVLAGAGKANRIVLVDADVVEERVRTGAKKVGKPNKTEGSLKAKSLLPVRILWDSDITPMYARHWSKNVSHKLFRDVEEAKEVPKAIQTLVAPPPEAKPPQAEATANA